MKIPIYYINLDDAVERRIWMELQASKLNAELRRVEAVRGADLPPEAVSYLANLNTMSAPLGPAELGCFLSHRKMWEQFLNDGSEWAMCAEDDLHFSDDAKYFLESTEWIPNGADLIKPETTFRKTHISRTATVLPNNRKIHRLLTLHGGSGAYFLNRNAAKTLLDATADRTGSSDHVIFNPDFGVFNHLQAYQIAPAIIVQDVLATHAEAGFVKSWLNLERKAHKLPKLQKIGRELARPLKQLIVFFRNKAYSVRYNTKYERVRFMK